MDQHVIFTEDSVTSLYQESLRAAEAALSSLSVAEGRKPKAGVSGWVFEQTIRHCLAQELEAKGVHLAMKEQEGLRGRAKVDLLVGAVAVELKVMGSFGPDDSKYKEYRTSAESKGWAYFYLAGEESYAPYRQATQSVFDVDKAFFLDTPGDWARFVDAVIANNRGTEARVAHVEEAPGGGV